MLISIQDDLVALKSYLKSRGYDVADASEKLPSDVFIYSQERMDFPDFENSITPSFDGTLIINADKLSLSEIENMIKHRTYTPLFS